MKTYLPIVFFLVFSSSCASLDPAQLTKNQMEIIVNLARENVFTGKTDLTEQDKLFIKDNQPKISYYILSGTYAEYSLSWDVDAFHRIIVFGQGDVMALEGAVVKKLRMKK